MGRAGIPEDFISVRASEGAGRQREQIPLKYPLLSVALDQASPGAITDFLEASMIREVAFIASPPAPVAKGRKGGYCGKRKISSPCFVV